jgi:hypothetical protein
VSTTERAGAKMTSLEGTRAALTPVDDSTESPSVNETFPKRSELAVPPLRKAIEAMPKGVGESHCFTLYGSFKLQPLHPHVSALSVQQGSQRTLNGSCRMAISKRHGNHGPYFRICAF